MSRRWLLPAGVAVTICAGAFLARAVPSIRARHLPSRQAQWIWEPRDRRDATPTALLAARRFSLERAPARAQLLIAADREYVLYLNGKRIGVGAASEAPGAVRLDAYEVAPVLAAGANRIVVELRSAIGHGGLLARLADEDGRTLVATDDTWRVFRKPGQGVIRGWVAVTAGQPAFSWGLPPVGRWGSPVLGERRRLLTEATGPAVQARVHAAASGQRFLYDFGREVTGLLQLEVKVGEQLDAALLWSGLQPPRPHPGAAGSPVLVMAGHRRWLDARPRRLRYVLVVGLDAPATARMLPVDPADWGGLATASSERRIGVLGILAPPLRSPVEDEVWRKFQAVARVAGREKP